METPHPSTRLSRRSLEGEKQAVPSQLKTAAIYGRVSAHKQKADLQRQLAFLSNVARENGYSHIRIYKDIASGLNDRRNGLKRLIRDGFSRQFSAVFITHRDRIARFGASFIFYLFSLLEVDAVVSGWSRDAGGEQNPQSLLVGDVLAILTSYAGKLHRLRRGTFTAS